MNKKVKGKKTKRKVRYDRILIFLGIVLMLVISLIFLFNLKITNIYIKNNHYLKDQQIIEIARLSDYPISIFNSSSKIEERLTSDTFIKSAKVTKKWLTNVYIEIEENRPLFYYDYDGKTVLLDGTKVDSKYPVPTVLNYITDTYYKAFVEKMGTLDENILTRISEIEFKPNNVDDNRFLFSMSDGNYVYVNIETFDKLNKYLSILEGLPNKNGILYLDYGNNFEIIE